MQYIPLAGRVFYSAIFLMFGLSHFTQTAVMAEFVPSYLPAPTVIVIVTGFMIVSGGLMILLGYRARTGALLLVIFLIAVVLMVHLPGFAEGDQVATGNFMRDLALAGAALMIRYFGSGPKSLDEREAAVEAAYPGGPSARQGSPLR
ncbi:MAG: DoxX family protein [Rhodothermales bacterium]|nr:DoxX family protein [Rhodothermales bacterium]MBO6781198.1 DoxX family protein [Rhodothermales bacterium]